VLVEANRTAATYAAFCRNYGHYATAMVGSHNWNEEAIERMIRDLTSPWQRLRTTLQNQYGSITRSIEDLIDLAIQYLGESQELSYAIGDCLRNRMETIPSRSVVDLSLDTELQDFPDLTAILSQVLTSRQHLLLWDVEEVCKTFEYNLSWVSFAKRNSTG
jgi:hypothetical protein